MITLRCKPLLAKVTVLWGWSLDEAGDVIESNDAIFEFEAGADVSYYAQFVADDPVEVAVTQSSMFRGLALWLVRSGQLLSVEVG